ncbi:hypothetical protein EXIGUO8H_150003 [Exiguobacterium sp. 8H]|uniref:hypothetical protein n=1 Tax=unclassified Exiguobacterium TaxID=2644629 RepID=UPI0012F17C8E|nr:MULTISPECIES: hypothetical protein [unclassified Exiguobacterium]VXB38810.1 hypothetical protein EXIGUO8H_150003 [Exiguobacterium sp. 8H]VXC00080.1 hypothetical protein EXIGUO8A_590015 [Exiguobacterium sp. 8A]
MKEIQYLGEWAIDEMTHFLKVIVDSRPEESKAVLVHASFENTYLRIEALEDGKLHFQPNWLTSVLIDYNQRLISIRTSEEALTSEEWEKRHNE